ncbi:MAG: hypothetical protein HFG34_03040 [Eubacterium sp.]|nr:hypothetical protein [Eubacterium sp.]
MQRSTLPTGVRTLRKWYEKGTLTFDNPVQRSGSQWSLMQKSLLIHSLLAQMPVPPVYLLKDKTGGETIYDALDGKQRMQSVFEFIDGAYALHISTPEVVMDGVIFDLANLSFEELSEECQDEILGYRFSITCLEDATDEEVEEIFKRLNNSTPLSPIQKCRSELGLELSAWAKEVCQKDFFQHSISLTVAQLRREADLEVLLQTMLLLDARHEGYDYKAISTREVTKYCKTIRGKYDAGKRRMMEEIIDFVSDAFPEKHRFLKKSNIPMILVTAKLALENGISEADFKTFTDSFSNSVNLAYEENMGSGNVKRIKTEGRLTAIAEAFASYFQLRGIQSLTLEAHAEVSGEADAGDSLLLEGGVGSDAVEEGAEAPKPEEEASENPDETEGAEVLDVEEAVAEEIMPADADAEPVSDGEKGEEQGNG